MPVIAISRVRGIGVADIESTSTEVRSRFICSLCSTPNRCSSSTMISPRSLIRMSGLSSRWVPTTMSTVPAASPSIDLAGLLVGLEPGQALDHDREAAHPLAERREVLGDQQRGRHQHGHLLAVLHRLERRADRDLGLAVADVAAHQPVHRHRQHHVGLDLVDRAQLVGGLVEREGVLELALPRGVRAERVPAGGLPGGVQLDQLGRDLPDRLAGPALALGPVGAAEPVEAGLLAADVAGHLVERVGGDVEPVGRAAALGRAVLEDEVLADRSPDLALLHLHEPADAVLLVHDVVAGRQLERVDLALAAGRHLAHVAGRRLLAGQVLAGEQHDPVGLVDEALGQRAAGDGDQVGGQRAVEGLDQPRGHVVLGEHLDHPLRGTVAGVDHDDAVVLLEPLLDVADGLLDVAAVGLGRSGRQHPALDRAHRHVDAGGDDLAHLVAQRVVSTGVDRRARHRRRPTDPERAHRPPRLGLRRACARARRRWSGTTRRRGRSGRSRRRQRPPSSRPGTPRWWRPGRGRGSGPARGRPRARGCRPASGRPAAPSRRPAREPATPSPRRRCRPRSCRSARAAAGAARPARPRGGVPPR